MKKFTRHLLVATSIGLAAFSGAASAQALKFGFVNTDRIFLFFFQAEDGMRDSP